MSNYEGIHVDDPDFKTKSFMIFNADSSDLMADPFGGGGEVEPGPLFEKIKVFYLNDY